MTLEELIKKFQELVQQGDANATEYSLITVVDNGDSVSGTGERAPLLEYSIYGEFLEICTKVGLQVQFQGGTENQRTITISNKASKKQNEQDAVVSSSENELLEKLQEAARQLEEKCKFSSPKKGTGSRGGKIGKSAESDPVKTAYRRFINTILHKTTNLRTEEKKEEKEIFYQCYLSKEELKIWDNIKGNFSNGGIEFEKQCMESRKYVIVYKSVGEGQKMIKLPACVEKWETQYPYSDDSRNHLIKIFCIITTTENNIEKELKALKETILSDYQEATFQQEPLKKADRLTIYLQEDPKKTRTSLQATLTEEGYAASPQLARNLSQRQVMNKEENYFNHNLSSKVNRNELKLFVKQCQQKIVSEEQYRQFLQHYRDNIRNGAAEKDHQYLPHKPAKYLLSWLSWYSKDNKLSTAQALQTKSYDQLSFAQKRAANNGLLAEIRKLDPKRKKHSAKK